MSACFLSRILCVFVVSMSEATKVWFDPVQPFCYYCSARLQRGPNVPEKIVRTIITIDLLTGKSSQADNLQHVGDGDPFRYLPELKMAVSAAKKACRNKTRKHLKPSDVRSLFALLQISCCCWRSTTTRASLSMVSVWLCRCR